MGVLWRSFFILDVYTMCMVLLVALFFLGGGVLLTFHFEGLYVSLLLLAVLCGVLRCEFAYRQFMNGRVYIEEEYVEVEAMVCAEPDVRDGYTLITIVTADEGSETRFKVRVSQYPEFSYGEKIFVSGYVHVPESFTTDTGRVFNYDGYLMKDGVHYELKNTSVASLGVFGGNVFTAQLLKLKRAWLGALSRRVPEPSASLAGGLVVGAKRSLGEKLLEAFRDTGIIHIVVLSGYNLTIIANVVVRMTNMLPRAAGFSFGFMSIVGFATMVGGGATVVRASIMATIGMLTTFIHRPYMLMRTLMLAGLGMVLWNPFVLAFDPGFQLSFLATLGLIFIAPKFERFFFWVPTRWGFPEITTATFATQCAVLPLLLYQMGQVSIVAPFVNLLVLPLVPFVMLTGFLAGVFEMTFILLSIPFAWMTHVLLTYMFYVVTIFDSFTFASLAVPAIPLWVLVLMYVLPTLYFFYSEQKQKATQPV